MIGDIILWVKKFIKRQTCVHEYETMWAKLYIPEDYKQCKKCGRVKKI